MNPVFLRIGNFEIRYYGLMYALAFFIGTELAKRDGKRKGLDPGLIENYAIVAMISGLIGGRLYYVLFNLPYYLGHPLEIPAVWHGGMAIHGGILGGVLGTYIFGKRHGVSMWKLGDIVAAPFILGQAIGRIGNFMNGEVHGVPTFTPLKVIFTNSFPKWWSHYQTLGIQAQMKFKEIVPWGVVFPPDSPAGAEFPNIAVHPAMLYELVLNFIAFLSIWFYFRHKKYKDGVVWFIYIIEYSLIRSFVSFFRAEDLMFFNMRAPHFISILMILWAIISIKYFHTKKDR